MASRSQEGPDHLLARKTGPAYDEAMMAWHDKPVMAGLNVGDFLWPCFLFIAFVIAGWVVAIALARLGARLNEKVVRSLRRNLPIALYLLGVVVSLAALPVPEKIATTLTALQVAIIAFFMARTVVDLLAPGPQSSGEAAAGSLNLLLRSLVWIIALLFALDNIGFDITALATGLGVGGVAVALASQAALGDLVSYFVILLDRPFREGDTITAGKVSGKVARIGLRATELVAPTGEVVIIPNSDLLKERIGNSRNRTRWRLESALTFTLDTEKEKIEGFLGAVEARFAAIDDVVIDRAGATGIVNGGVVVELVFLVETPDNARYQQRRQEIAFTLLEVIQTLAIKTFTPPPGPAPS